MLIAGLTLGLGIFAVFGAILYRIATMDDRPAPVATATATEDNAAAEAAVRSALAAWNAAFNAGDAKGACALFAPDLRYDYAGLPERNYDAMCAQLERVLADRSKTFAYALDLKEVIVSGDIAVARLVWTLTIRPADGSPAITSTETGMDMFRKQPDGTWRISRFIAFDQ